MMPPQLLRNYHLLFDNPDKPWKDRGDFILSDFHVTVERAGQNTQQDICHG